MPQAPGSLSGMAQRELAGRHWGKEPRQSCWEEGAELLAPGTSFVRHVHPLLPRIPPFSRSCFHGHRAAAATAAGSPCIPSLAMHPGQSRAHGPASRGCSRTPALGLGVFAPAHAHPRPFWHQHLPHRLPDARGWFSCATRPLSHFPAFFLAQGSISCTCAAWEGTRSGRKAAVTVQGNAACTWMARGSRRRRISVEKPGAALPPAARGTPAGVPAGSTGVSSEKLA